MKIRKMIREFLQAASKEGRETKEAVGLMRKYASGEQLTEDEVSTIKAQMVDTLKIAGVIVPFALIPGSSLLLPLMVSVSRKYGFEILPSAFSETIVYVRTLGELSVGDMVECDGSRWIVSDVSNGEVCLDGYGRVEDAGRVHKVTPYLATKNVGPGDMCVDEHNPGDAFPYDPDIDCVKLISEIERTEYRKII